MAVTQFFEAAFQQADPGDTLASVVTAFARFWDAGRPWIRRVRALGVLDRELGDALEARNARRRHVVRAALERLGQGSESIEAAAQVEIEDVLYTLTSFETFDSLAGPDQSLEDVARVVARLALAAVGQKAVS